MKYVNIGVVFQEIPDEVTLAINISNCPCHCMGCHSEYLWEDVGQGLNVMSLNELLRKYGSDITCVCFMGGDGTPDEVDFLAAWMRKQWGGLKIGWYSGRTLLSPHIHLCNFDYIKLGPYVESKGGLASPTTNQRLYRVTPNAKLVDITHLFWKKRF